MHLNSRYPAKSNMQGPAWQGCISTTDAVLWVGGNTTSTTDSSTSSVTTYPQLFIQIDST